MIKIYALIDPRTQEIKYVGQTVQQLYDRLACHVDKARRNKDHTLKADWIRDVLQSGGMPKIKLLDTVPDNEKASAEKKYILMYSDTVLNMAPAGAGGSSGARFDLHKFTHLLGVLSDGEIAEMSGVTRKAISYHRKKLQIPIALVFARKSPPPPMGGWNKLDLPKDIMDDLGKYPDYVLGGRIGVAKTVIARARKKMNIPPYAKTTGNDGRFKPKKGGSLLYGKDNCNPPPA